MHTLAFLRSLPLNHLNPLHPLRSPSLHKSHSRPPKLRQAPRATLHIPGTPPAAATLSSFSERIRGEWTGYEGTFSPQTSSPNPIPDYYIPEQFVEWNLTPHGFESTHSLIVRDTTLYRKFFRILPAVTLFADHVDLEENLTTLDLTSPSTSIFEDGGFVASPPRIKARQSKLDKWPKVEFCLRDPRSDVNAALHVDVLLDVANRRIVGDVRAVLEQFACIYCDGADLEGSSGYVEGWTVEKAVEAESLRGEWSVQGEEGRETIVRDIQPHIDSSRLYLPKGIDINLQGDTQLTLSVGWLVTPDLRIVLQRTFDQQGDIQNTRRQLEKRIG